jgi:hypothetical protein
MNTRADVERNAGLKVLRAALENVPNIRCDMDPQDEADLEISRSGCHSLRVRLRPWSTEEKLGADEAWLLRSSSAAQQQRFRERGEDFVALNGAVRVVRDWLVLDRTNLPSVRATFSSPPRVDPFSDRNSLIPRTLLADPERSWGVRELAQVAGVALGTASQVVRALATLGAVEQKKRGRTASIRLTDAGLLLRAWFAAYAWDRNAAVAFNAPVGDVSRFVRRLPELFDDTHWALTLHAGAAQVSPHATWDRVHLYVAAESAADLPGIGESLGWEPSEDGRVVLMRPYYRTSVWHGLQTIDTLPVVSPLQLVLDLWHYPLRGREQAEHLMSMAMQNHG